MTSTAHDEAIPSPAPNEPPAPAPRRNVRAWVIGVAVVVVLAGVIPMVLASRGHVTTDDAQIEGHVVPVVAKVGGYVTAVGVEENQAVHAGDVLVQLDDRDLRARLEAAEARIASAEAVAGSHGTTGEARAQLTTARANVAMAEAAARRTGADLERFRTLAEHNIISRQQLDQAEAAAAGASAQLAAARGQVAAADAGERVASGQLAEARAARDEAALQMTYTRIVAPLDGVVARKAVEIGQLVQAGQQIMNVVPVSDIWIVANLKETQMRGVVIGDPVEIRVDGDPSVRRRGRVESMSPATGAKFSLLPPDNASGNFTKVVQRVPVRIRLVEPNDPAHPLRPGMSVKVTIRTS